MAFAESSKVYVNFTGGLNTDFTQLNFPENAATDLDNVDIFRTGEVKRRKGMEFEGGYTLTDYEFDDSLATQAMSTHEWKAVAGKGTLNFLGVQVGARIFFHDLGLEPMSDNVVGVVDLEPYAAGNGVPGDTIVDSSFGEGVMVVTNVNMDPVVISYDSETAEFSTSRVEIEIRDFDGLDDELDVEERPTNLNSRHRYNLRNQGWPELTTVSSNADGDDALRNRDPIVYTSQKLSVYPSNADIFTAAKAGAVDDAESLNTYSPWDLEKIQYGNTPAPKGHFIFNVFDQNRSSASGIGDLPAATSVATRPSATAFYAGRIWYAGVPDTALVGDVFFSQSLTDPDNAGKCYQEQDPTAEDLNQLVATDGGVIHIADMGQVYKIKAVGQDLMLVASNGVWAISGPTGANFSADEFTVRKVTDVGTNSANSVVESEGTLFYWANGGIYATTSGQISDDLSVNRITRDKIQNFYDQIPQAGKAWSRGWYDSYENRVIWLYNDQDSYDGIDFRFSYNRILILDLTLGAFYTYTMNALDDGNTPFIASITQKEPGSEAVVTYNVVQGTGSSKDNVIQGVDNVCEDIAFGSFTDQQLKFLVFVPEVDGTYEYTFAEFDSTDFVDWKTWDQIRNNPNNTGGSYSSYLQAGWENVGDLLRNKKITHLTSFFNRTETGYVTNGDGEVVFDFPSGCNVQTRWEWTDTDTGRWTAEQQAYRLLRTYIPEDDTDPFEYGHEVVKTKLRMRGKGTAFSVRFSSDEDKDFQLLGFAVNIRAGSKV